MNPETSQFKAHCEHFIGRLPELAHDVIRRSQEALKAPSADLTATHNRTSLNGLARTVQLVQNSFHETLTHRFQIEVAQARQGRGNSLGRLATVTRLDELSLVDESAADSHIELARTVQEIGLATEWSLRELQAFTAALRGESEIHPDANPFSLAVFARALRDAIATLDVVPHERQLLLRVASRALAEHLNKLYIQANLRLEAAGITPLEYKTVVNLHGPSATTVDMTRPGALDRLLQQLPGGAHLTAPEVAAALDQAFRPSVFGRATDAIPTHDPQRIRGLNQLWERMVSESAAVPYVQPMVRSLQTSMLRLAVREPAVADDLQHPVWQFINDLVAYVGGFRPEEHLHQQRFVESITPIVQHLADHPSPHSDDFKQASQAIHEAMEAQSATLLESRAATLKALEEADHLEMLKSLLLHQVNQHLDGRTVPLVASDFLRGPWLNLMVQLMTQENADEAESMGLLNVVEDLVTSLQRPTTLAERERLRLMLPSLTERLRKGMALINWPPKMRGDLMEQLMVVHARYLRSAPAPAADAGATSGLSPLEIVSQMRAEQIDSVWAQHDPQPEPQVGVGALPTVPMGLDALNAGRHAAATQGARTWAEQVRPGTWFKLSMEGEWVNARLMWVSANHRFFMFTGRQADEIRTLPLDVLSRLRQEGLVTDVPQHTLVQRAADSLWSDLDS